MKTLQTVLDSLSDCTTVIVTTHVRPDMDALASSITMARWLKRHVDVPVYICTDEPAPNITDAVQWTVPDTVPVDGERVGIVVVDAHQVARAGKVIPAITARAASVVVWAIDHHPEADNPIPNRIIAPAYPSCTAQLYDLILDHRVENVFEDEGITDPVMLTAILAGVYTDTLSFAPVIDRSKLQIAFRVALQLVPFADLNWIEKTKLHETTLEDLNEIGAMLSRVKRIGKGIYHIDGNDVLARAVMMHVRQLTDFRALVVTTDNPDGTTRVSLRSEPSLVINTIAKRYGGGGHPNAAGCTICTNQREQLLSDVAKL